MNYVLLPAAKSTLFMFLVFFSFSLMPDDSCFLPLNLFLSYNSPNHSLIYVDGCPLATVSLSVMEG